MEKSKPFFLFLFFSFLISNSIGCATIAETAKCVAGVSTQEVEDARKDAIKKAFNYDYSACYKKTKEILGHIGAYIYAEDLKKGMIALYLSSGDTTPVGIFLTQIDAANTQIEVSSASKYAKEQIAKGLFGGLEKDKLKKQEKDQALVK